MNGLTLVFQSLASTSVFAFRPFAAAFAMALMGRLIYDSIITGTLTAILIPQETWLISDTALLIFGLLAILEWIAADHEEFRSMYNDASGFFQSGSALVVQYGLADGQTVMFFTTFVQSMPTEIFPLAFSSGGLLGVQYVSLDQTQLIQVAGWLGHAVALIWAILMAGGAWFLGTIRYTIIDGLETIDPTNAFGMRTLAHWIETGWTATAIALVVFLPLVSLGVFLVTVGALALIRWYFQRQDQKALVSCSNCSQPVHLAAPICHHCKVIRQPHAVGWFGQVANTIVADPAAHRVNLLSRKRCPTCATILKERSIQQQCPTCGTVTFADVAMVNTFLREIDRRMPKTLLICFLLGLIPVVGIVPGIIYYQISLVSSLRGYIPRTTGCLTRWGVRMINLFLISWQWVPGFGALTLPLMAVVSYQVHRGVVVRGSQSGIMRTFSPVGEALPPGMVADSPMTGNTVVLRPTIAGAASSVDTSTTSPLTEKRDCPNCSASNDAVHKFCHVCGYNLLGT
ncbi:MAG: hypothetical protein Fur005_46030 [Roseiflexaceae bacterium]